MTSSFKQTLFLSVLIVLTIGTVTGVHLMTNPIITQRETDARNQAYLDLLQLETSSGYTFENVDTLSDELMNEGVEEIMLLKATNDETLLGAVYTGEASGWGGAIRFQLGLKGSVFSGFSVLSQQETRGIGDVLLTAMEEVILGLDISDTTVVFTTLQAYLLQNNLGATFASVTRNAILDGLDVMVNDYQERVGG